MNLHSTALLGPVIITTAAAGHLASPRARLAGRSRRAIAIRGLGLTLLTALACLATPYGISPITHASAVRQASVGLITEWLPAGLGSTEQVLAVVAILLAALAAWFAARAQRWDTVAVLALFAVASGTALRFAPLAVLPAIPELALAAGRLPIRRVNVRRLGAASLAIMAIACCARFRTFADPGVRNFSPRLVADLPAGCRLLNDMLVGGAVMLHRPDVPVSIDGRNDLYGRAAEIQYLITVNVPARGKAWVNTHQVNCVLLPSNAPLVPALEHTEGWRVVGTDSLRTLLVRAGPA
jgi:hypothetical protein